MIVITVTIFILQQATFTVNHMLSLNLTAHLNAALMIAFKHSAWSIFLEYYLNTVTTAAQYHVRYPAWFFFCNRSYHRPPFLSTLWSHLFIFFFYSRRSYRPESTPRFTRTTPTRNPHIASTSLSHNNGLAVFFFILFLFAWDPGCTPTKTAPVPWGPAAQVRRPHSAAATSARRARRPCPRQHWRRSAENRRGQHPTLRLWQAARDAVLPRGHPDRRRRRRRRVRGARYDAVGCATRAQLGRGWLPRGRHCLVGAVPVQAEAGEEKPAHGSWDVQTPKRWRQRPGATAPVCVNALSKPTNPRLLKI